MPELHPYWVPDSVKDVVVLIVPDAAPAENRPSMATE
jgi:hypothetical protein